MASDTKYYNLVTKKDSTIKLQRRVMVNNALEQCTEGAVIVVTPKSKTTYSFAQGQI